MNIAKTVATVYIERESYTLVNKDVVVLASNKIRKIIQDSFIKYAFFALAL